MQNRLSALDYWFAVVAPNDRHSQFVDKIYEALMEETPPILSVVGERACNLQCAHCIFQAEKPSSEISRANALADAVTNIVRQMESDPIVVHEGRIFRPWHLDWLKAIRDVRSDAQVGMIDNGTFLNHRTAIHSSRFQFDWIDISLDGPETVHNFQRKSKQSFETAIRGIENAHEFLAPDGRVTSLFTLTTVNHASVLDTSRALPEEIDEWHITTLSPTRPEIASLATSTEQLAIAWRQTVEASRERQLFFRIYVNDDLLKLARVAGEERLAEALHNAKVADVAVFFELDDVQVIYYPTSVVVGEEFILDADARLRMPYSIAYTLEELQRGMSLRGEDLGKFTVSPVDSETNARDLFRKSVAQWREKFGQAALQKEINILAEIHKQGGG